MIISPLLQNWAKTVLAGPDNAPFCLVAVADLKGSAPREIGAVMLVYADHIKGSIGGGALEHQAIETAFSGFIKTGFKRQVRSYALGPSLGQCCGGTVRLMFEWYGPDGRSFVAPLLGDGASYSLHDLDGQKIPKICPRSGMPRSKTALALSLQHQTGQVFIYGAGHVGRAVIELARHLNCQLYWVDVDEDRYPHTIPPEVIKLPARTPEAIAARAPKDTIHLIMTYSHQLDYEIASALLSRGQFAKCGLIGSKTKAARFRKRLGETGLANAQLDRLICPIGLVEVKGKAPFQVALSVTAQLSGWLDELLKLAEQ
jgi:xanthine dehydrogenase accessory factor